MANTERRATKLDSLRAYFAKSLDDHRVPSNRDVRDTVIAINNDAKITGSPITGEQESKLRATSKSTTLFKQTRIRPPRFQTVDIEKIGRLQTDCAFMRHREANGGFIGFIVVTCIATGVALARPVRSKSGLEYERVIRIAAGPRSPFVSFSVLQSDGEPALRSRSFVARMKLLHGISMEILTTGSHAWSAERLIRFAFTNWPDFTSNFCGLKLDSCRSVCECKPQDTKDKYVDSNEAGGTD